MATILILIAVISASSPVAAIVLFSVTSRKEDSAWTLGGPAPDAFTAAGRRMVGFHTSSICWPRPTTHIRPEPPAPTKTCHPI
jgi:hypothetical protein